MDLEGDLLVCKWIMGCDVLVREWIVGCDLLDWLRNWDVFCVDLGGCVLVCEWVVGCNVWVCEWIMGVSCGNTITSPFNSVREVPVSIGLVGLDMSNMVFDVGGCGVCVLE